MGGLSNAGLGSGWSKLALATALVGAHLAEPRSVEAAAQANQQVSPFYGSFSHSIPIEVPSFHGLEPRIALGYSSEGRNGILGVGWSLAGISHIERVSAGRGTPLFDSTDAFVLDGQELVACPSGSASPSCTSGGTHATKLESYLKIRFDSALNQWTVFGKDGTRTIFSALLDTTLGTLRWGQTSVVDTKNNTVTYGWSCPGGDCYPETVSYNGYLVRFYWEARPDTLSFPAVTSMGQTSLRLRSVFVQLAPATAIRAYKLSYATSTVTGRSLLTSVQTYGRDVVQDGSGAVLSGTALPPQTFEYQQDPIPVVPAQYIATYISTYAADWTCTAAGANGCYKDRISYSAATYKPEAPDAPAPPSRIYTTGYVAGYFAGDWSICSAECGGGYQTRTVYANSWKATAPASGDTQNRPLMDT